MADFTTVLGLVAGCLTTFSLVPQILKVWRCRSAEDVSYKMYFVLSAGSLLWIYYGVLKEEIAIIITNSMTLVLDVTVIYLKWKFSRKS
jgi:MtN3 and saliva related transmembrane protein